MLEQVRTDSVLFLDIETVPQYPDWETVPEQIRLLWDKKEQYFREPGEEAGSHYNRAGIYAEFGQVICISAGMFTFRSEELTFTVRSYAGQNEKQVLTEFASVLRRLSAEPNKTLCAHNGKDFDYPYLARRMMIHGINLPSLLDNAGKKPWEVRLLDTMELWKFGEYKHFTSLDLLTTIFGIPTPKDDIDGSQVAEVFYQQDDLERITRYCEKDVIAIARLFLKWKGEAPLKDERIRHA